MYNVVTFEVRMSELRVGVRELKSRLSEYLRRVKLGETILVTEHGHPLGRIVPAEMPLEDKMKGMISSGAMERQKARTCFCACCCPQREICG
jgi:prevent-host-death family protein